MANLLVNPSFDLPAFGGSAVQNQLRPPWVSNRIGAPVGGIEVWRTNATNGVSGLLPYPEGSQYLIEMDSAASVIEQVVNVPASAGTLTWRYYHHRRNASDRLQLRVGDASVPFASNAIVDDHTATNNIWNMRTGTIPKPAGVTQIRFRFQKISPFGGTGSLVDAAFLEFASDAVDVDPCDCCPVVGVVQRCFNDEPVTAMICDGAMIWFDSDGNVVPVEDLGPCT